LFPRLSERTCLQRLLAEYEPLTDHFLVEPEAESIIDSYGVELIHPPIREGRSSAQIGEKAVSNHRFLVGVKMCWLITPKGQVIDWGWNSAEVNDQNFRDVGNLWKEQTQILADSGFQQRGRIDPKWTICQGGEHNDRMVACRVFSLITVVNHFKKVFHRSEQHLHARFGYVAAMFNCFFDLAGGKLALAQFSL